MSSSRPAKRCSKEGSSNAPPSPDTPESAEIGVASNTSTDTANSSLSSLSPASSSESMTEKPSLTPQETHVSFAVAVSPDKDGSVWEIAVDLLPLPARKACLQAVSDIVYKVYSTTFTVGNLSPEQHAILMLAQATSAQPFLGSQEDQKLEIIESFIRENQAVVTRVSSSSNHFAVKTKRALPILRIPTNASGSKIGIDLTSTNGCRFYFIQGEHQPVPLMLVNQLAIQIQQSRNMIAPDDFTVHAGYRWTGWGPISTSAGHWVFFDCPKLTKAPYNVKINVKDSSNELVPLAKIIGQSI